MKSFKIELRWGILFSLALMIWGFIEKNIGWHDKYIDSQLGNHFLVLIVFYAVIYYFGIREKRKSYYHGIMNWKEAFISGAMISVIIAILSPLTQFFIYHYISPDYFQQMIAYQVHKTVMPMSENSAVLFFSMKGYIIQAIFTSLSLGLIMAALMALVLKRKSKE